MKVWNIKKTIFGDPLALTSLLFSFVHRTLVKVTVWDFCPASCENDSLAHVNRTLVKMQTHLTVTAVSQSKSKLRKEIRQVGNLSPEL